MPPGQYLFAGLINQIIPASGYFFLRVATIILSSLVSVNIYKIGKENFNQQVGILAGYLSIISLPLIFHSFTFSTTTLAALLLSFFVLFFFRAVRFPSTKHLALSGFCLGVCALTRTEMLALFPFVLLWFLIARGSDKKNVWHAMRMLLIAFLIIFCWSVRNYVVCKKFVLISTNGSVNFFIGNNPIQSGGYLPPRATAQEKQNYFLAGITYNLQHPGWFVRFFKEKFKLYWSSETYEHPHRLLKTKFEKSTIKVFNDKFSESRLSKILASNSSSRGYTFIILFYTVTIWFFWFFVFCGIFFSHLWWRQSYFLLGICLGSTLIFSLFFSGSNGYFLRVLPYCYIMMAIGIHFLSTLAKLNKEEIKAIAFRNAAFALLIISGYALGFVLVQYPATKTETITGLHYWNLVPTKKRSLSLMILESQLSYPISTSHDDTQSLFVWIDDKELPYSASVNEKNKTGIFSVVKIKDLLCRKALLLNIPYNFENSLDSTRTDIKNSINTLNGKIVVQYTPAWQFHSWIEKVFQFCLAFLQRHTG